MTDHKDDFSVAALERLSRTAPHQALAAQCLRERQRCADLEVELNTSRMHWGELKRILGVPEGDNALAVAEELRNDLLAVFDARVSLREFVGKFASARRMGAEVDEPEGARWVQVSETLVSGLIDALAGVCSAEWAGRAPLPDGSVTDEHGVEWAKFKPGEMHTGLDLASGPDRTLGDAVTADGHKITPPEAQDGAQEASAEDASRGSSVGPKAPGRPPGPRGA